MEWNVFEIEKDTVQKFKDVIEERMIYPPYLASAIGINRAYLTYILKRKKPLTKKVTDKLNKKLGTDFVFAPSK